MQYFLSITCTIFCENYSNLCCLVKSCTILIEMFIEQLQASSLQTFLIIGKVSSEAVIEAKSLQNKSLLCWLNVFLDEILLEVRLFGMQIALWLLQLRKSLAWRK